MEKLYGGNTMAQIKDAVRKIDSTPELKRAGAELTRKAKEAAASRKKSSDADIGSFSKEVANFIVGVPISTSVCDTPSARRAYERAFGKNKRVEPGRWIFDKTLGRLVKAA